MKYKIDQESYSFRRKLMRLTNHSRTKLDDKLCEIMLGIQKMLFILLWEELHDLLYITMLGHSHEAFLDEI